MQPKEFSIMPGHFTKKLGANTCYSEHSTNMKNLNWEVNKTSKIALSSFLGQTLFQIKILNKIKYAQHKILNI